MIRLFLPFKIVLILDQLINGFMDIEDTIKNSPTKIRVKFIIYIFSLMGYSINNPNTDQNQGCGTCGFHVTGYLHSSLIADR
jgi:hypothetical protein